jgi:hypothetical protein
MFVQPTSYGPLVAVPRHIEEQGPEAVDAFVAAALRVPEAYAQHRAGLAREITAAATPAQRARLEQALAELEADPVPAAIPAAVPAELAAPLAAPAELDTPDAPAAGEETV